MTGCWALLLTLAGPGSGLLPGYAQAESRVNSPHPPPNRVLLLGSHPAPIYQRMTERLQQQLQQTEEDQTYWHFEHRWLNQTEPSADLLKQYDLLITLGTEAARWSVTQTRSLPVLHTLITRQAFQGLIPPSPHQPSAQPRQATASGTSRSAIFLDQPYERQLHFAQLIFPDARRLGTLMGPKSRIDLPHLQQLSLSRKLTLNSATLDTQDNPIQALQPVISNSDMFLAIPDQAVFNRNTARWILMMTYRHGIPLIAYSQRYVEAGALAAIFSSPESIGRDTADWLRQWQRRRLAGSVELLPARYPQRFEIEINRATARSLQLQLPDIERLRRQLQPLGQELQP